VERSGGARGEARGRARRGVVGSGQLRQIIRATLPSACLLLSSLALSLARLDSLLPPGMTRHATRALSEVHHAWRSLVTSSIRAAALLWPGSRAELCRPARRHDRAAVSGTRERVQRRGEEARVQVSSRWHAPPPHKKEEREGEGTCPWAACPSSCCPLEASLHSDPGTATPLPAPLSP
jgi:hypothetical protein